MIPKLLHFIWVGDEAKRPANCIKTWRDAHPGWELRVWGNDDLLTRAWANFAHIETMLQHELCGVADMMRWEILHESGGIVIDADSVCVRPLDEALLQGPAFACWENEIVRPGQIATGVVGCEASNPFVRAIIEDIAAAPSVTHDEAWQTVGPQRLTDSYRKYGYSQLRIHPSHYFIPKHFTGQNYEGEGPVYAHQLWGSRLGTYDEIHLAAFEPEWSTPEVVTTVTILGEPTTEPEQVHPTSLTTTQATSFAAGSTVILPSVAAAPIRPALETLHDPYLVQRVEVGTELASLSRLDVFASLCAGKRVLHVGCGGSPDIDPQDSLHALLESHCAMLDGFDSALDALERLAPHVGGNLYTDLDFITASYDVVLVPEAMELASDVAGFLARLEAIEASCFLISVTDAFQSRARHGEFNAETQTYVEVAHPERSAWYTPYTLSNTIRKYSGFRIERLFFFDGASILALASRPALAMAA